MNNKNVKREIFFFWRYEALAIEEYLERKALEGWFLRGICGYIFTFEKREVSNIKYLVRITRRDIQYEEVDASSWKPIERCTSSAIKIYYSVECSSNKSKIINQKKLLNNIRKEGLKNIIEQVILLLLYGYIGIYRWIDNLEFNMDIFNTILCFTIDVILVFLILYNSIYFLNSIKRYKNNKEILWKDKALLKIKNISIKSTISVGLILLCIFVVLVAVDRLSYSDENNIPVSFADFTEAPLKDEYVSQNKSIAVKTIWYSGASKEDDVFYDYYEFNNSILASLKLDSMIKKYKGYGDEFIKKESDLSDVKIYTYEDNKYIIKYNNKVLFVRNNIQSKSSEEFLKIIYSKVLGIE